MLWRVVENSLYSAGRVQIGRQFLASSSLPFFVDNFDSYSSPCFFFNLPQMNYEGSTHPMSRLRKDAKKSCQQQGASCERAENGPITALRTASDRARPQERTPRRSTALGVDVGIQRPEDGGVARNELRHDTTSSLHADEQEDEVQGQQVPQLCERFAR